MFQDIFSPLQFTSQLVYYIVLQNATELLMHLWCSDELLGKKATKTHIHVPKTLSQVLLFLFHRDAEHTV